MSSSKKDWDVLGLIHFGSFLIVVGLLFIIHPNLFNNVKDFILDFEFREVADNFFLPIVRSNHPEVYNALFTLGVAMVLVEVLILVARFMVHDTVRRKADSISGIVFWAGVSLLANQLREGALEFQVVYSLFAIIAGISVVAAGAGIILARRAEKGL